MSTCFKWSNTAFKWNMVNWPWSQCAPVKCYYWGNNPFLWKSINWFWSKCSPVEPPVPPVVVIADTSGGGIDPNTLLPPMMVEPWNPYQNYNKKKLIKLICKVKGKRFEQEKEAKTKPVKIFNIKPLYRKSAIINLSVKM